jgi:hypothetical protein
MPSQYYLTTPPAPSEPAAPAPRVVVADIEMRFSSMIVFMIKWAFACVPAIIILAVLWTVISVLGIGFLGALTGIK